VQDKSILILSLDASQRSAIKHTLELSGFTHLIEAASSEAATTLLASKAIDAVICDIDLGHIDGWRFSRLIRSGALTVKADTPIIVVSDSYSERIAVATAKAYQVNYFVPFDKQNTLPALLHKLFSEENKGVPRSRLLVVEDYPDTVELVKRVLANRFEIDVAITGKAGLEAWKEKRHDLVLLDVMLPEMSGNDVLKEILAISPNQSVVMMTAQSTPERAAELVLNGAVDYISKPFRADQLRNICEIAVQREDFLVSHKEFAQHQEALHREKELAQITLQSIADGVIRTDAEGKIEYMNPVAERLTGWSFDQAKGQKFRSLMRSFYSLSRQIADDPIEVCIKKGAPLYGTREITFLNRDGNELILDHVTSPINNRQHQIIGAVMVFRDVTEAHELERQLEYQAKHDLLTGLTNRAAFEDRLEVILNEFESRGGEHALCYIDLDQFKVVNDTCGHIAGDQLLQRISSIILHKIRRNRDTLARFGGDEFVLLLEECPVDQAKRIAESICQAIQEYSFTYEDKTFVIGASIGVVPITAEIADVNDALRMADNSCYVAKEKGRNRVHIYHMDDQELIRRRGEMHVVSKIHHALENNHFALFFQQYLKLDGAAEQAGKYIEILLRMRSEEGGWMSPGFFLPAAERYNLAPKIDRWVINSVMTWLDEHRESLEQVEKCSINLSGLSFCDHSFADFIREEITRHNIPVEKICFEITETAAIQNLLDAVEFINQLKSFGCSFALDDFGSGMSSYAYLKALPIDYLKIDGVFVKDLLDDPIDHAMVKSINEIGHVFGLKTIAEFVETEEVVDELKKLGVDFAQGYVIAKPAPIAELLEN